MCVLPTLPLGLNTSRRLDHDMMGVIVCASGGSDLLFTTSPLECATLVSTYVLISTVQARLSDELIHYYHRHVSVPTAFNASCTTACDHCWSGCLPSDSLLS